MSVTRELSFEGVETTAEPPVCDLCGGSGVIRGLVDDAEIGCFACGGDEKQSGSGYERGDDASLLASVPDEDWSAFYGEGINEPGVVRGSRYQQVSEDVVEVGA